MQVALEASFSPEAGPELEVFGSWFSSGFPCKYRFLYSDPYETQYSVPPLICFVASIICIAVYLIDLPGRLYVTGALN